MVVEHGPGDFYRLQQIPTPARNWLKYNVPGNYRYYEDNNWFVHGKHLLEVVELAYKDSGRVDYSALNDYIQMEIAKAKENWRVNPPKSKSLPQQDLSKAYATLHLLPTASIGVVGAVWRCLAKETHPDRGGDEALFRKYSEAFDRIKKDKSK